MVTSILIFLGVVAFATVLIAAFLDFLSYLTGWWRMDAWKIALIVVIAVVIIGFIVSVCSKDWTH